MSNRYQFSLWDTNNITIVQQFVEAIEKSHGNTINLSREVFLWKHRDNPAGPSIFFYAINSDNGEIAATQAFSPRIFAYNRSVMIGYESNDTTTLPAYRRQGLFSTLLSLCIRVANERNGSFVIGHPNLSSQKGFLNAGWRNIGGTEVLFKFESPAHCFLQLIRDRWTSKPFIPNGKKSMNLLIMNWLEKKNIEDKLLIRNSWMNVWNSYRNKAILEWRFAKHPQNNYQIVGSLNGDAIILPGMRGSLHETKIIEAFLHNLESDSVTVLRRLIDEIRKISAPDIMSIILSKNHPYYHTFRKAGFYRMPSKIMFYNYPLCGCDPNLIDQAWAISGTDIDTQ